MYIVINIPKAFEKHFLNDKFKDSFERIKCDIEKSEYSYATLCSGNYEKELIDMLENAFRYAASEQEITKQYFNKIKNYAEHLKNGGLGKQKSLDFISKYIDNLFNDEQENDE